MANKADERNPLLSTPVATIAVDLFRESMTGPHQNSFTKDMVPSLATASVECAEQIVSALRDRGHLPPEKIETDDPKTEDGVLILQGIMLGVLKWTPFEDGDPRGVLRVNLSARGEFYDYTTKLVGGVPSIDDTTKKLISSKLAPLLRRL